MATHKSAKKRARSNKRKNLRNRSYMSMVRTAIKKLHGAVQEGQSENIQNLFLSAQSLLDKAAQKGILHKKNASRRVGRLSARIAAAANPQKDGAAAAKKAAPKAAAKPAAKKAAAKKARTTAAPKKSMPKKKAKSKK